tara:strand:- start:245 stop:595 length:351 start_codon:yes stop_codon:yes gene_type:complete
VQEEMVLIQFSHQLQLQVVAEVVRVVKEVDQIQTHLQAVMENLVVQVVEQDQKRQIQVMYLKLEQETLLQSVRPKEITAVQQVQMVFLHLLIQQVVVQQELLVHREVHNQRVLLVV